MKKPVVSVPVRAAVEFSLLSGSLTPGGSLARMRDGTAAHQARQRALEGVRTEVVVRGRVEGEVITLAVNGRIDVLYERDGLPVIEEIKLAPLGGALCEPVPEHWAQAVCYGHLLGADMAIIRIVYVTVAGEEAFSFEDTLSAEGLAVLFDAYVRPYLAMVEARHRWRALRDETIRRLPFPFPAYRDGQRDMAVHAYWAIKSKKRLFAQAPTGTGKTAAALFPALKALGEGLTGQLFYLTARTTAGKNAAAAIERMRGEGLRLRALTLTAKEKMCAIAGRAPKDGADAPQAPAPFACDVLNCPYAIGFYDRLPAALSGMRQTDDWSREAVSATAEAHRVCPFEFQLSLCEEADAVVCDYNYAFDPGARLRRIFLWSTNLTLLVDEAHNLPDRARAMLSAPLQSAALRAVRRDAGKALGRSMPLYKALTRLIRWIEAQPEGACGDAPYALVPLLGECVDAALAVLGHAPLGDLIRTLIAAIGAMERFDDTYAVLTEGTGRRACSTLSCLNPAPYLAEATRKLRGCIFFSATLTPLYAWRDAIGGQPEDGLLSLPSPFPAENMLVLRYAVTTRYKARDRTAAAVANAILAMVLSRPGNYLACFPSYAYLRLIREEIEKSAADVTVHAQRGGMDDAARADYLAAFTPRDTGVLLGMVVLGGVFGEGVDLPGERLSGVAVVGVGLPQICPEREMLRDYFNRCREDGFAHAYRFPGMNKVLQAVGRVIRTETDLGVALLIDDRFLLPEYAALMPPWWSPADVVSGPGDVAARAEAFWRGRCGAVGALPPGRLCLGD